jgi:hypothetical protein
MAGELVPAWIKELNAEEEKEERARREFQLAQSLIRSKVPEIWEDFIRELTIQVNACKLLSSVRNPRLDDVSQSNPPEKAYKVTMYGSGPFGKVRATTVRLKTDGAMPYIECLCDAIEDEKDYKINFRVNPVGEVELIISGGATPQMAAEHVVRSMATGINKLLG